MAQFSVLVAEPDASQRQIIEMLLLVHDCEVVMALNAREALSHLQDNTPDLVIASTQLPQINGYDLSRKLRGVRRLRNVPVILTTGADTALDEARTEAELAGADLLLMKPLGDKNLGERAVSLIRTAREQQASGKPRPRRSAAPQQSSRPSGRSTQEIPAASVLSPVSSAAGPDDSDEVKQLRKVVADLSAENATLRQQLTGTGRATSTGAGIINDLRERLARANELLEEYRRRYPELENQRQSGLGKLLRRKL